MFIISLTYKCDLDKVDKFLDEHVIFLNKEYEKGSFIVSGRKVPRNGGIILSNIDKRDELNTIIERDPFYINNIAKYEIVEFVPSMTKKGFENLLE